jgi:hypothetical protein
MEKREQMPKTPKATKQLTLDNIPKTTAKQANNITKPIQQKQIIITQIDAETKEDELALKIAFKLFPSKTTFSKVQSDLGFDNQQITSVTIRVLQGPLATEESEFTAVLDMKGIPVGSHIVKVEMFESTSSNEKLYRTLKEIAVDYLPKTRQSRLIKVPTVKCIAGADLVVISNLEKSIYSEFEQTIKNERLSKRDVW